MIIVGLTGSIAMGKSAVAAIFASHGIPVFDADKEVHALYQSAKGAKLVKPLVPEAVIDGQVDRNLLARAVLGNDELLEKLETAVHAEVARSRSVFLDRARDNGEALVVVDVPLLFEKGHDKDVDLTVVVSAPVQLQHQRALARPGMTRQKLDAILSRQMPDAEKRKRADIIIENNGSLEDLREHTEAVIQKLKGKMP